MDVAINSHCTAFAGMKCIASGEMASVALMVKEVIDGGETSAILIFDDNTSQQVEIDFRGTSDDVLRRLSQRLSEDGSTIATHQPEKKTPRGPGRPKLGVVAREVTLLPRHWDWLSNQPGGASVALRKLVEDARRTSGSKDIKRKAQEACYRFIVTMAGNLPGFEETTRALFSGNSERFNALSESWPADIRNHARKLAALVFQAETEERVA